MSNTNTWGTALITGASTGIGAAYAAHLAKRGYDLILVARNKDKLENLAVRLAAQSGVDVRALPADLTVKAEVLRVEKVLQEDASISLLVNNAGAATFGPLADADIERLDRDIQLNVVAPTRLARAVLPGLLRAQSRRHHQHRLRDVRNGAAGEFRHGGTKAYLLHLSEVLALEVGASAVRVQAVLPGATRTALWDGSGVELSHLPPEIVMEVDEMVRAAPQASIRESASRCPRCRMPLIGSV